MRFPDPVRPATLPCARCRKSTRVDRLVAGAYGENCAAKLGLITATVRLRTGVQSGITLLDLLNGDEDVEPDDECDGADRPADRDMPVRP